MLAVYIVLIILHLKKMKKFIIFTFIVSAFFFSGCNNQSGGNPKEVLSQFFKALSKKDVDQAKKYATKDSDGMLNMMEMGIKMSGDMQNDHADKMFEMMQNVEMSDPVINGNDATITVKDKKSGESTDFLLKKEDGNWKVAFDMSTLTEMGNKKLKEHGMENMNMDSMKEQMNQAMDSMKSAMPAMKDKMDSVKKMMDKMGKDQK